MTAKTGCQATVGLEVQESDTAPYMRSGEVPVLATPRVVAICEEAAILALSDQLEGGETSVGARVEIAHVAPVGIGSRVRATATLERCEGRRLVFSVSVSDDRGLVAAGKVTRVVVDRDEFLSRAR
ncbi:MAG TPA: hotdog domain-containing protein [Acidimicrobiales bacterium]|nr:hotdog domain-containing protein [Acidimicrobiales bacterium]